MNKLAFLTVVGMAEGRLRPTKLVDPSPPWLVGRRTLVEIGSRLVNIVKLFNELAD